MFRTPEVTVINDDCTAALRGLADSSIDAAVTDPDYELVVSSASWIGSGTAYELDIWQEMLRVLKPGGYLLAFGATRTWHRLAVAIEDAGFEIRDSFAWLYGTGFPKSHDVSKAIDKAAGARGHEGHGMLDKSSGTMTLRPSTPPSEYEPPEAVTAAAQQWRGWGTALKPAFEPVIVARKPLDGTVAENVLRHGTGALNIDGSRIGDEEVKIITYSGRGPFGRSVAGEAYTTKKSTGRWPANVLLDESQADELDQQRDGTSRFFYTAKATQRERVSVEGVSHPTVKPLALMRYLVRLVTPPHGTVLDPFAGSGTTAEACILEGFDVVAIEREHDYIPLIEARVERARNQPN